MRRWEILSNGVRRDYLQGRRILSDGVRRDFLDDEKMFYCGWEILIHETGRGAIRVCEVFSDMCELGFPWRVGG